VSPCSYPVSNAASENGLTFLSFYIHTERREEILYDELYSYGIYIPSISSQPHLHVVHPVSMSEALVTK